MSRPIVIAAVLALAGAFSTSPARAVTFTFAGVCTDCAGTATAELVLNDYTLGAAIDDTNFVSFRYGGTNLLPAYTISAADLPSLSGSIDGPLPASESVVFATSDLEFVSNTSGGWCTGARFSCGDDLGASHLWSAVADDTTTVPEPLTISLLGGGLLGLAALRRKA